MLEKISDTLIREEKVRKLKIKILDEIERELNIAKEKLKVSTIPFDIFVKRSFALLNLKEYISKEHTFMDVTGTYSGLDVVFYTVGVECLNIWLQDDYHFVNNFLYRAAKYQYNIFDMLNDYYFGYKFNAGISPQELIIDCSPTEIVIDYSDIDLEWVKKL